MRATGSTTKPKYILRVVCLLRGKMTRTRKINGVFSKINLGFFWFGREILWAEAHARPSWAQVHKENASA
jgi:hypothetical protein